MRAALLLAGLVLAGCSDLPADRDAAFNYHRGLYEQRIPVRFVRNSSAPVGEDAEMLARLHTEIAGRSQLRLETQPGPLADARAAAVEQALGRRVPPEPSDDPGRNEGILVIATPGIVAEACEQAPARVGRNLWTFDDYSRQRLLPPGCANATMLLRQAALPADTLRGRPLEPGAAGPMARAADRYLRRNDERVRARGAEGRAGTDATEETPGPGAPATTGAPATDPASAAGQAAAPVAPR